MRWRRRLLFHRIEVCLKGIGLDTPHGQPTPTPTPHRRGGGRRRLGWGAVAQSCARTELRLRDEMISNDAASGWGTPFFPNSPTFPLCEPRERADHGRPRDPAERGRLCSGCCQKAQDLLAQRNRKPLPRSLQLNVGPTLVRPNDVAPRFHCQGATPLSDRERTRGGGLTSASPSTRA